jgi:hypothetical protein
MNSSAKMMCCLQILDKYMYDIDGNVGDIKKWTSRLKTSVHDEDEKNKRVCMYINAVSQLVCIYQDAHSVLNVDNILDYIQTVQKRATLVDHADQLNDIQSEIKTIMQHLKTINYTGPLDDDLIGISHQITNLLKVKSELVKASELVDAKHKDLVKFIRDRIGSDMEEHLIKCESSLNAELWNQLYSALSDKNKPHTSCREKITKFIELLNKTETTMEGDMVKQLDTLNIKYSSVLLTIIETIKTIHRDKWNKQVLTKIEKIISGLDNDKLKTLKVENKTEFMNVIRMVFNECYIMTNKFIYKLETQTLINWS